MDNDYKKLLETVTAYSVEYLDGISRQPAFPEEKQLERLSVFDEPLPEKETEARVVIEALNRYGAPCTTAQNGGRFFGFVNGGLLPAAHGAAWLSDTWNQNSALYVMSPVSSKLEAVCERWITELLGLPADTAMGLVTGSSNAMICAFAAARNELLRRQGYDVGLNGLRNAPEIRIAAGEGAHSSVKEALFLLGIGEKEIEIIPADQRGAMRADRLPALDEKTLLILQAGNVNGGAFDPVDEICDKANGAGAWVHIDGAFGLWAAASEQYRHLTKGIEKADSWSVDAHKTLNAGYDCGIVLCRHRKALQSALQASGAYISYSANRDGMLYTTEMSRRSRGVVLWAVLKQLGKKGMEALIDHLFGMTGYFAEELEKAGLRLINPPFANQFMIAGETPEQTGRLLRHVQDSGICWCSGSVWEGEPVIRISVCSHSTTKEDIDKSVEAFRQGLAASAGKQA